MAASHIFKATLDATTNAVGPNDKIKALISHLGMAFKVEVGEGGTLTVGQQLRIDAAVADAVANIDDFIAALSAGGQKQPAAKPEHAAYAAKQAIPAPVAKPYRSPAGAEEKAKPVR